MTYIHHGMNSGDTIPTKNKIGDKSGNTQKDKTGRDQQPFAWNLVKGNKKWCQDRVYGQNITPIKKLMDIAYYKKKRSSP